MEVPAADQLAVADLLLAVANDRDDAVLHGERVDRRAEARSGALEEETACLGGREPERGAAALHAGGAGGAALIARERGVAHHDLDPIEGDVELVRDDLRDRDVDALAHVHLPEVRGDAAVAHHRDPRVQLVRREGGLARDHAARLTERDLGGGRRDEADDEGAGAPEELAA